MAWKCAIGAELLALLGVGDGFVDARAIRRSPAIIPCAPSRALERDAPSASPRRTVCCSPAPGVLQGISAFGTIAAHLVEPPADHESRVVVATQNAVVPCRCGRALQTQRSFSLVMKIFVAVEDVLRASRGVAVRT